MSKQVKDVSQSTNLYEIAEVIQQLNPNAEIRVGDIGLDSMAMHRIFSSVPVEQLILPEGFYYNEKNGITNKHNTQTGSYCALKVEDLAMADERILLPKIEKIVSRNVPNTPEQQQTIKQIIVNAIQKLKNKSLNKKEGSNGKTRWDSYIR